MKKYIFALLLLSGCNCGGQNFNELVPIIVPSQNVIDFGQTYIGGEYVEVLEIENAGGALLAITSVSSDDERFTSDSNGAVLNVGETFPFELTFVPDEIGVLSATLTLISDADNGGTRTFELRATVSEAPDCEDQNPCTADSVNFDDGTCVHGNLNGISCDDGNLCSTDTRCVAGECLGAPVQCADPEIACARGVCDAEQGCTVTTDNTLCDDDDPCTADTCDAEVGCLNDTVDNGTPCGPFSCEVALLCTFGECVGYDVPDGSACFDGNSCTVNDYCLGGACVGEEVSGPIEVVDSIHSFGGPSSLVAVDDQGTLVFVEDNRLTRVIRDRGVLRASERFTIDSRPEHAVIVDGKLLLIEWNASVEVRTFELDPFREVGVPYAIAFEFLFSRPRIAASEDFLFFCAADQSEIAVVSHGGEIMPSIPLTPERICSDVTYEDEILTVAESVASTVQLENPVHLSTWTLDEEANAIQMATLTPDRQQQCNRADITRVAAKPGALTYSCGVTLLALEPGTLRVLEDEPTPSPFTIFDITYDNEGQLITAGRGPDSTFQLCSPSQCSVPKRIDAAPASMLIGGDTIAISGVDGSGTYPSGALIFSADTLTSMTGPEHGTYEEVEVLVNGLAVAGIHSAHKLRANPLRVEIGASTYYPDIGFNDVLGFGANGPPYLLVNESEWEHTYANVFEPTNPISAPSDEDGFGHKVLLGDYLYFIPIVQTSRFVTLDPQSGATLSEVVLPARTDGWTRISANEEQIVVLRSEGDPSVMGEVFFFDVTNPRTPRLTSTQEIDLQGAFVGSIHVAGNKLAILTNYTTLHYYSFTPETMTFLGEVTLPSSGKILHLEESFAFVQVDSGLAFVRLDVSPPRVEQIVDLSHHPRDLEILNDKVYVAGGTTLTELSPVCPAP